MNNYQRWSRGHKARGQGHTKIYGQGQGQTFRRHTLSRPRTGMLEVKANSPEKKRKVFKNIFQTISKQNKNKRHKKMKRSSKFFFRRSQKKGLQKFFQACSTNYGLQKNFSADLQNFKLSKNSAVQGKFRGQISRAAQFSRT